MLLYYQEGRWTKGTKTDRESQDTGALLEEANIINCGGLISAPSACSHVKAQVPLTGMLISSVLANKGTATVRDIKLQMQDAAALGQLAVTCHIEADLSVIQRSDEDECHRDQDTLGPFCSCHSLLGMTWC